jgi:uncharacterized protein (TIGR02118 family)
LVSALILFGVPKDAKAFEEHFARAYRPLLQRIPELQKLRVNRVAGAARGETSLHMLVELQFDSEEAMQAGLNSEQGQAMARDLGLFASGGVSVLLSHTTVESTHP